MSLRRSATVACALGLALSATPVTAHATAPAADGGTADCQLGTTAFIAQRGLSNALPMISTPQSWQLSRGKGVTVAVVDSGVNVGNQHLTDNVEPGFSLLADGDGRTDLLGHGTAVAGVIAARKIPQSVLEGQAPEATILPVRVYDLPDSENNATPPQQPLNALGVAQGIRWAADHGADVINVSISSGPSAPGLAEQRDAVRHAQAKGALIVASSGDSDIGAVTQDRYPASFPGVIGVAAANTSGRVDDYSVHSPGVDVIAPGQGIMVAFHANGDCLGGDTPQTSYSAGFVSGLAAQLKQRFPRESNAMIAWRIMSTAKRDRPSVRDDSAGWGLVQPYAALTLVPDPSRPGPAMPGAPKVQAAKTETGVQLASETTDPMAGVRREAVWWALGGVGLAALALLLRPLLRRRAD